MVRFKYDTKQWATIVAAVEEGCLRPFEFRKEWIYWAVKKYLEKMPSHRHASRRVAALRSNARCAEEFRKIASKGEAAELWQLSIGKEKYARFLEAIEKCRQIAEDEAEIIRRGRYGPNNPRFEFFESVLEAWL